MANAKIRLRNVTGRTDAQSFFALNGRPMPTEVYRAFISAPDFDFNQQYWIQRGNGVLQPVRAEPGSLEQKQLPAFAVDAVTALDADQEGNTTLDLWVGNTSGTAVLAAQDPTVNNRYSVLFSWDNGQG